MADNKDEKSLEDIIAETMKKKKEREAGEKAKSSVGNSNVSKDSVKPFEPVMPPKKDKKPEKSVSVPEKTVKKKKTSKKKKVVIALVIVVLVILLLLGGAFAVVMHYINKVNIVDDTSSIDIADSIDKDDDLTDKPDSPQEDIDALNEKVRKNLENQAIDIMSDKDVFNVLLIGTDARDKNSRGRSDSMILVSINKKSKKVVMTSFMRDIYLAIPGVESTRLNHSYAYGGAPLLIQTLQENFKIKIDKYVQVNFYSFIQVVDSVGGVEINVTDAEVPVLNNYIGEINRLEGRGADTDKLQKGGKYNLNGVQALGYSRIRYIGNADFQRTERQRTVLEKVIEKMSGLGLSDLNDLLNNILPAVTTNIQKGEMISLILNATDYFGYARQQCRVPVDGSWQYLTIRGMSVLGVDFDKNISYLKSNIYD